MHACPAAAEQQHLPDLVRFAHVYSGHSMQLSGSTAGVINYFSTALHARNAVMGAAHCVGLLAPPPPLLLSVQGTQAALLLTVTLFHGNQPLVH